MNEKLDNVDEKWFRAEISKKDLKQLSKKISVIYDSTQKVLASCDMAIVASGTATLEAAILSKPMVVIYKSNKLSNFILSNGMLSPSVANNSLRRFSTVPSTSRTCLNLPSFISIFMVPTSVK